MSSLMYNTHFEEAKDLDQHWLLQDCIKSVKRDLYFSISTRYYCGAGCKVCYIQQNLKNMKKNLDSYYFDITPDLERKWEEVFDYFEYLRTDDDMYFLKYEYPTQYDWFCRNAHRFEYGMTDNQIFRYLKIANECKFKGIASISISSFFAGRVQQEKLLNALTDLHERSPIQQIKLIDTDNMNILRPFYDWAKERNIETMFHYDFLNGKRELLEADWVDQQVTWIDADMDGTMQVYGDEAVCLFFDRFYFSNDVATDPTVEPYYILNQPFDPEKFLTAMARGKQTLYNVWRNRTINTKFRKYFSVVQNYEFEDDYNFIPSMMMVPFSLYCKRLEERGWVKTKHGLLRNDGNTIKSFVRRK
jgi:hypothetical protein